MERIRCPNCGSTAQVQLMWHGTSFYGSDLQAEYVCGCGCKFEATFVVTEIRELEEK